MKKVLATGLVGVMSMTALVGCGSKDSKDSSTGDSVKIPSEPIEIAKMASERTAKLDSYELNGKLNFDISAAGETVKATADMNAVYFKDPMKMKMDFDIATEADGKKQDISVDAYFMKEDDTYVIYAGLGAEGQTSWVKMGLDPSETNQKQLIDALDVASKSDSKNTEDAWKGMEDCLSLDKENNTDDATALLVSVTADQIKKAYEEGAKADKTAATSAETSLAQVGMTTDDLFEALGTISVNMSVNTDQVYWKSIKMDLAKPAQGLIDSIMSKAMKMYGAYAEDVDTSAFEIKISACDFELNYDKYNKASDFEIPEEAKNAKEINLTEYLTGASAAALQQ